MKRVIFCAAVLISGTISSFGQGPNADETKAMGEVMTLVKEFTGVLVSRDPSAVERILAPEYVDPGEGLPTTQNLLLRSFEEAPASTNQLRSITLDEKRSYGHIYGNTAVVVAKVDLKWKVSKEAARRRGFIWPVEDSDVVTFVAAKIDGKWRIVLTHASPYSAVIREVKS